MSELDVATSEEVWGKVDLLATDRTQGEQERLDKSLGLKHCREGVLFDRALRPHVRPSGVHTYDPMHTAFCNGIASFEVHNLLLQAKAQLRIGFPDIEQYLQADWRWPSGLQQKGNALHQLFNHARDSTYCNHFTTPAT